MYYNPIIIGIIVTIGPPWTKYHHLAFSSHGSVRDREGPFERHAQQAFALALSCSMVKTARTAARSESFLGEGGEGVIRARSSESAATYRVLPWQRRLKCQLDTLCTRTWPTQN